MKFTANKESLLTAVTCALKGISGNSRLPILSGILLNAQDGALELQATDLEISIQHKIPALIEEPGQTVVPGKVFLNIIKDLPDAAVKCSLESNLLKIQCERSRFKLHTMDPRDFEDFPRYELERSVELPVDILSTMVSKVIKAASTDKTRAILNGVLLSLENNTIRLVATDSYRLAVADSKVETSSIDELFELIIPSQVLKDVLSLPHTNEKIMLGEADNQIVFISGHTVYVSRKIEGNFPKYRQLLPQEITTRVRMNALELTQALRRVSIMATNSSPVKFTVQADQNNVTLFSATPDQGGAEEYFPAEIEGENIEIAFNHRYVLDGFADYKSEDDIIELELQSSLKPGVFKSYGVIDYLYLVMPVRMSS